MTSGAESSDASAPNAQTNSPSSESCDALASDALRRWREGETADTHALLLSDPGATVSIDVAESVLVLPDGTSIRFPLDSFTRHCLVEGIDQLGYLQKHLEAIRIFEETRSWTP